jgi:hypothetical protein
LPANIPAILVNNPKGGHMQTFMDKQGGLVATAAVNFFDWFMKGSEEGKAFFNSANSKIKTAGWQVQVKNMKA